MVTEAATNGRAHACRQLGNAFRRGLGVKKNKEQAAKWYRKMSECDEENGPKLKSSLKAEALDWLRRYDAAQAAAAGDEAAAE